MPSFQQQQKLTTDKLTVKYNSYVIYKAINGNYLVSSNAGFNKDLKQLL